MREGRNRSWVTEGQQEEPGCDRDRLKEWGGWGRSRAGAEMRVVAVLKTWSLDWGTGTQKCIMKTLPRDMHAMKFFLQTFD